MQENKQSAFVSGGPTAGYEGGGAGIAIADNLFFLPDKLAGENKLLS